MLNFILGFFAGALVVDFLWAYKMGLVQLVVAKFKYWRANRGAKLYVKNNQRISPRPHYIRRSTKTPI